MKGMDFDGITFESYQNLSDTSGAQDLLRLHALVLTLMIDLRRRDYPAIFVGTGLWDSQVQYWEPSKYVAPKTDDNLVVYRVQMEAEYGGKSDRFQRCRETPERYAFLLN